MVYGLYFGKRKGKIGEIRKGKRRWSLGREGNEEFFHGGEGKWKNFDSF